MVCLNKHKEAHHYELHPTPSQNCQDYIPAIETPRRRRLNENLHLLKSTFLLSINPIQLGCIRDERLHDLPGLSPDKGEKKPPGETNFAVLIFPNFPMNTQR